MAFKGPHVSLVSFAMEITPAGTIEVMIVETDLHLNSRHPHYDARAVATVIDAVRAYLAENASHVTHVRLTTTHSGEV
jgi:hypothetical protein